MLDSGSYQYVCKVPAEVPEVAKKRLPNGIVEKLGGSTGDCLPELTQAFPLTVEALERNWPKPELVLKQVIGEWLAYLVLEREDLNIFFKLAVPGTPIDGEDFEFDHRMLPHRWKELYRRLDSFTISDKSIVFPNWHNTPCSFSSRLLIEDYRQVIGAKVTDVRELERTVKSGHLTCWLWTDCGDALLIDEDACDRNVYHVRADAMSDVYKLPLPEDVLDHYLAHLCMGGSCFEFNWRM